MRITVQAGGDHWLFFFLSVFVHAQNLGAMVIKDSFLSVFVHAQNLRAMACFVHMPLLTFRPPCAGPHNKPVVWAMGAALPALHC